MSFPQRTHIVGLEGVLGEVLTRIRKVAVVVERDILQLRIGRFLLGMLARQGEQIRESELLALAPRLVLIVEPPVPGMMAVARQPIVFVVAVEQVFRRVEHRNRTAALHVHLEEITAK